MTQDEFSTAVDARTLKCNNLNLYLWPLALQESRWIRYGCFAAAAAAAAAQQPTVFASPISTRSARLSRPLRRSPNGHSSTSSNSDNSLPGQPSFPFSTSLHLVHPAPSRELLVNGRRPHRLQGLIGSPYSRRKYSPGCLGHIEDPQP